VYRNETTATTYFCEAVYNIRILLNEKNVYNNKHI